MKVTFDDFVERRGSKLLLVHCAAGDGVETRPTAQVRLQQQLGDDFARKLVRLLTPRQPRSDDLVA